MFSLRGKEPVPLEIRSFKADREYFLTNLLGMTGACGEDGLRQDESASVDRITVSGSGINRNGGFGGGPNGTTNYGSIPFVPADTRASRVEQQVRAFYAAAGMDLSTNSGKAVIWNDRKGILTIRATAEDLDLIEKSLQVVNAPMGAMDAAPRNPTAAHTNPNVQAIFARLDQIRVDADYPGMPLQDVLDDLHRRTQATDSTGQGINFVFNRTDPNPASAAGAPTTVQLALRDVPVSQVLGAIVRTSSRPVGYAVMDYGVDFSLAATNRPPELQVRNFVVNKSGFAAALRTATGTELASGREPVEAAVRKYFLAKGIDLSTNTGKVVIYNEQNGILTIRATKDDLDAIEAGLNQGQPAADPAAGDGQTGGQGTPGMGGFGRPTNVATTSPARKVIFDKLHRISINDLNYADVPLKDALDDLATKVRARDPDGRGINFLFSPGAPPAANNPTVDAYGNLVRGIEPPTPTVKVNLTLKNVTLGQALDGIRATANPPIEYQVFDYGIVFSIRGNEPLEIRNFKIDGNIFSNGLTGGFSGGGGGAPVAKVTISGNGISPGGGDFGGTTGNGFGGLGPAVAQNGGNVEETIRAFFGAMGIDLSTNNGKAVIWNNGAGILTVKATTADLDVVEKALQVVNTVQPMVNIKVKFVEITQNENKAFGFQWTIGGITNVPGSATNLAATNVNPLGIFPGTANTPAGMTVAPAGGVTVVGPPVQGGASNVATTNQPGAQQVAAITGILTPQQYAVVLQAVEQRDGTEVFTAPEVTTESGRQAQMRTGMTQRIVTFGGTTTGPTVRAINRQTNTISLGPEVDVVPYVTADKNAVQMAMIPSITEFVGYTNAAQSVPQAPAPSGGTITTVLPLPHFKLHQVLTSTTVWDGETVAIGGFLSDSTNASGQPAKKNLMIFVTVKLVNPDGTRFHSDEELEKLHATPPPTGN